MKSEFVSGNRNHPPFHWTVTLLLLGLGCWLMAVCWHEWLCDPRLAACFDCEGGRRWLVRRLQGRLVNDPVPFSAKIPFENVLVSQIVFTFLWWIGGAVFLRRRLGGNVLTSLQVWGGWSSLWWLLAGSWTVWRMVAALSGLTEVDLVLSSLPEMWLSFASAGWFATFFGLYVRPASGVAPADDSTTSRPQSALPGQVPGANLADQSTSLEATQPTRIPPTRTQPTRTQPSVRFSWMTGVRGIPCSVWIGVALYTFVFGVLNTVLYANLLIPHGDSAMYEEHLWNVLHGKGFRSFIDQGLFLGEHIQVIHLGLIPIYLLWPSHVCLEWLESCALALGAVPVYRMAFRQTGNTQQSSCLALAYLMFIPTQRLDISIDFKTFRPEAFGIPLLLAAINGYEQRGIKGCWYWLLAVLLVKEDYALILGPFGVWWIVAGWWTTSRKFRPGDSSLPGLVLALGSPVYLWLAIKVFIPYFRSGHEVHYARYFKKFGTSINEIVLTMLTQPGLLVSELLTAENVLFAATLTFSLALLPLFSLRRLLVGGPLFVALALNEIARNTQHHFHAPLVAIVFWAAAHGLRNISRYCQHIRVRGPITGLLSIQGATCAALMALFASSGFQFWHSLTPCGLPFWDPYSSAYWQKKYQLTERVTEFSKVLKLIPPTSRVASTDFIHPRFNHFARSYDYSSYRPTPPADAEYVVVDVRGPYSQITAPGDVGVYREHPADWELLPDQTQGYYYVFRRRPTSATDKKGLAQ